MTRPLDFVLRWIQATGGLVERAGPDVHQVALPAPLHGFEGLAAVTDEIEVAREDPGVELVAPGSPLLDAVAREALGQGRAARVFLLGLPPNRPGDPARAFRFGEAAATVLHVRAAEHRLAVFTFHLLFESDEKEEDLIPVGVDLSNARILRRAAEAALQAPFTVERMEAWPLSPLVPLDRAYAIARGELLHRASAAVTSRQSGLEGLLRAEAARTATYYDDLCEEIASARGNRPPAEVETRVLATRRERERRLADLADKFRLRIAASLAGLLVAVQPKAHLLLRVAPPRGPGADLAVVWDPLLGAFEAAGCPGCGRPGFEFELASGRGGARLRCPLCPGGPSGATRSGR